MLKRQAILFGSFLCVYSLVIQAEEIGLAFGYKLGMPMSEVNVISDVTLDSGEKLKEVEVAQKGNLERILIGTSSDDKHVARIIGESPPVAVSDCSQDLNKTLNILQERHPGIRVEIKDEHTVLKQPNKSIYIRCEQTGDLAKLIMDYRDDIQWK